MAKNILDRLKEQLVNDRGMSKAQAHDVAVTTLTLSGSVQPGSTRLTPKGVERSEMGAKGRAIDRAATRSGHDPSEFVYSSKTNRATLRKK